MTNRALQLAYQQDGTELTVTPSEQAFGQVIRIEPRRLSRLSPEEVVEALLGRISPLGVLLGRHPASGEKPHPTHRLILRTLAERTGRRMIASVPDLTMGTAIENTIVVGGPLASRHAAAIFGTPSARSVLDVELPVHYRLPKHASDANKETKRTQLVVSGRSSTEECFLLTSLPMQGRRFVNISALTTAGGNAVGLVLGNETLMHELFVRTRRLGGAGWQALVKVEARSGEPVAVGREFEIFEIKGVDFESPHYPLNDPDFLFVFADESPAPKIEEKIVVGYSGSVSADLELDQLTAQLKAYLEKQPQNAAKLRARISSLLGEFSAVAAPRPKIPDDRPKWSDKAARKGRNPAQFIREEYKAELDAGILTRPALKAVDPLLYNAYAQWISPTRHPEDDLKLLTRSDEVSSALVDGHLSEGAREELLRLLRLDAAARMRKARTHMS